MFRKLLMVLMVVLVSQYAIAVPSPTATRPSSYSTGNVVDADEQNNNENTIYNTYNTHTHSDINSTSSTTWTIGGGTDVDHDIIINNGDASSPVIRYESSVNAFQIANDGTTFSNISTTTGAGARGSIHGLELVFDGGDEVVVNAGQAEIDDGLVGTTALTVVELSSGDAWIGGTAGAEVTPNASDQIYVYTSDDGTGSNIATFSFSYVAPDAVDADGNTGGINKFYTTGGTDYRVIGMVYSNSGQKIEEFSQCDDSVQYGDTEGNATTRVLNAGASTSFVDVDCSAIVPPFSRSVDLVTVQSSAGAVLRLRRNDSAASNGITVDSGANARSNVARMACDESQIFEYKVSSDNTTVYIKGYDLAGIR